MFLGLCLDGDIYFSVICMLENICNCLCVDIASCLRVVHYKQPLAESASADFCKSEISSKTSQPLRVCSLNILGLANNFCEDCDTLGSF